MSENEIPEEQVDTATPEASAVVEPEPTPEPEVQSEPAVTEPAPVVVNKNAGKIIPTVF